MEQINYPEEYKRLLSAYRSNSFEPVENDLRVISSLIEKFPFSQSLYFMQAAFLKNNSEKFEGSLFKAALRTGTPETLYQSIHHPDKFIFNATLVPEVKKAIRTETIQEPVVESITEQADYHTLTDSTIIEPVYAAVEDVVADSPEPDEHFILDPEEDSPRNNQEVLQATKEMEQMPVVEGSASDDSQKVSRYNDDTLPYTFLWWLNKTRKEHNENYQPYVEFKLDTTRPIRKQKPDQLNQQIIENIFHLNLPFDGYEKQAASSPNTVEFELKKKEDEIIDKFIKQDPQIRPMPAEKIDTENKAKKSAEDSYDLVSETLAQIYTEQMLFHKAIDTYKKLSLKFPEKNAYFADQISELEKRGN